MCAIIFNSEISKLPTGPSRSHLDPCKLQFDNFYAKELILFAAEETRSSQLVKFFPQGHTVN